MTVVSRGILAKVSSSIPEKVGTVIQKISIQEALTVSTYADNSIVSKKYLKNFPVFKALCEV